MINVKRTALFDFVFFLYMCAQLAHKQSVAIDNLVIRSTFTLLVIGIFIVALTIRSLKLSSILLVLWSLIFFLYVYLSSMWAADSTLSMLVVGALSQQFALCTALVLRLKDRKDCLKMLHIYLMATIYCAVLLVIRTPLSNYGTLRIGLALGLNANGLGMRMAIGFICALFFFRESPKRSFKRGLYGLIIISLFVLTLFTGSRKALFSCLVGFCMFYFFTGQSNRRAKKIVVIMLATFLALYLVFNVPIFYDVIGKRVESLLQYSNNTTILVDSSAYLREYLISEAKQVFKANIFFGCGANNFMLYNNYGYYAHNNYWEILSTLGLLGFIVYYSIYMVNLIQLFLDLQKERTNIGVLLLVLIIVIMICETGLVTYNGIFYVFMLSLGYLYPLLPRSQISGTQLVNQN